MPYSLNNGLGLPGRMVGPNGAITNYTYDARGHLLTEKRTVNGAVQTTTFAYDSRGRLWKRTLPTGDVLNYVYDDANRLTSTYSAKYQSDDGNPDTIMETP